MDARLPPRPVSSASRLQTLLARAVAVILGGALLVAGFVVSMAFFAVALVVALGGLGVFLWKTRHVRRQIREQMRGQSADPSWRPPRTGEIIEGTVIRSSEDEGPRR